MNTHWLCCIKRWQMGLEGESGLEKLVATFRIKRPTGYGEDSAPQAHGVRSFWADWTIRCDYTYLGTVPVRVMTSAPSLRRGSVTTRSCQ